MGVGKTTAIEVLLKYMIDRNEKTPVLLAFNEIALMERVYRTTPTPPQRSEFKLF